MRLAVIALAAIGSALTVLLLVGAWGRPLLPTIPSNQPVLSPSQSPDPSLIALPGTLDVSVAAVSALAEATATVSSDIAVTIAVTPPADEIDSNQAIDGFMPKLALFETPQLVADGPRTAARSMPSTSRLSGMLPGAVPVLMYHYVRVNPVASDRTGFVLSVTPQDFAQQIRFLASHGYTTVTVAEVRDYVRSGKKLPPKPIALTFDDGYGDAYEAVIPVLVRYHMTATFYIVTGFVDRPAYVTWDQVIAMDRAGMEIASHTVGHHSLPFLSPAARQLELTESRAALESRLGHAILDFCYPGGRLDVATEQAVARAGYLSATTTANGYAVAGVDPLRVPRIRISGGIGLAEFARILGEKVTVEDARTASPTGASMITLEAMTTPVATQTPTAIRVVPRQ